MSRGIIAILRVAAERQRVAVRRAREAECVQEFGALEEDVEVPAAVVVRPARELAQFRKQLVGGNAVERRHPRADDVLLVRCRTRNDERVREPEVAHGRAAFREPGALVRVPTIMPVVGERNDFGDANEELCGRQCAGARIERGHQVERGVARVVREGAAFAQILVAEHYKVAAIVLRGGRGLFRPGR